MSDQKWKIGPVKLVNGCDATIVRFCETRQRYIGEWESNGKFYAAEWHKSGQHSISGVGDPMLDLAPAPQKTVPLELWIVVYDDGSWWPADDQETAITEAKQHGFGLFHLSRLFEEGEGLL